MDNTLQELYGSSLEDIRLDVFEGPFDLLLSLLERNKLNIADISISLIADQYIEILKNNFDMEIASEFLVMASTLLHLKSRRLLPQKEKETEEITEEELIRRLSEYKRYKELAPALSERLGRFSGSYYKMPENLSFPKIYLPVRIDPALLAYYKDEIEKRNKEKLDDNTAKMERILRVEKVSIKDKMKQIVRRIRNFIKTRFSEIFTKESSRTEKVTGFLAMLELDKNKHVKVTQKELFGEITIEPGENFDPADIEKFAGNVDEYDENSPAVSET
ncbi:MAG: segregation/condensation protein A [Clostridia bacterium]|nr:segregation/condensation protein A [Clostridia bacterium]